MNVQIVIVSNNNEIYRTKTQSVTTEELAEVKSVISKILTSASGGSIEFNLIDGNSVLFSGDFLRKSAIIFRVIEGE